MTRRQEIDRLRRAGYYLVRGSYYGTNDDRAGRWYTARHGEPTRKWGPGYRTRSEAWDTLVLVMGTLREEVTS